MEFILHTSINTRLFPYFTVSINNKTTYSIEPSQMIPTLFQNVQRTNKPVWSGIVLHPKYFKHFSDVRSFHLILGGVGLSIFKFLNVAQTEGHENAANSICFYNFDRLVIAIDCMIDCLSF